MYYSEDWASLRLLLTNPQTFFAHIKTPTGIPAFDPPREPITAAIHPFAGNIEVIKKAIALAKSLYTEENPSPGIAFDNIESIAAYLESLPSGWFLAEYANRTNYLTIYYQPPSVPLLTFKYPNGYTTPTIAVLGQVYATRELAQVHFDLDPAKPGQTNEELRADFVVDYIQDSGKKLCSALDALPNVEVTELKSVFSGIAAATPVLKPQKNFKPNTKPGPTVIVERLSDNIQSTSTVEYFVCLQNSAELDGDIRDPNVPGTITLDATIVKVYVDPKP